MIYYKYVCGAYGVFKSYSTSELKSWYFWYSVRFAENTIVNVPYNTCNLLQWCACSLIRNTRSLTKLIFQFSYTMNLINTWQKYKWVSTWKICLLCLELTLYPSFTCIYLRNYIIYTLLLTTFHSCHHKQNCVVRLTTMWATSSHVRLVVLRG